MSTKTKLKLHLDDARREAHKGAARGLETAMEHLLGESRKEVPLEEGTLSRSGTAVVDESDLAGAVYYDTVYARRQHEELTWQHDAGRKAKYLEDPHARERNTMLAMVRAGIRRELGG